jgi:HEAT repeat protein
MLLRFGWHSSGDDASCAQAVSHLGGGLPLEKAKNILSRSLQKGLFETARACLEVLGHYRDKAVGVLEKVMTEEKGELAAAAALALGKTGEAAAERPLLQALRSEDSDLREAAVTALGRVGSAAAVQPLQEAAEGSLFDLFLRQAARQAVAEIQSRLEGASPGQISLAEVEAGQLSLAPFEAGQLSLAPDEAGQVPPPGQRLRN